MTDHPGSASSRPGADRPCPRCGTMRPAAATFCSNCGQDLRPGAPLGAMADRPSRSVGRPAPSAPPAKVPPPKAPLGGPQDAARPGGATTAPPAERATPQRIISRPPAPPADEAASFTERYRGTRFETPESKVITPPRARRAGARRYGRIAGAATLAVLVAAVALAGASSFLLPGGNASDGSNAQATGPSASASVTPGPAVGASFDPAERAQIAFCLSAAETGDLDADLASLPAVVTAARDEELAAAAADVVARVAEMRLAAGEMGGWTPLAAYGAAYDAALQAVAKVAQALQAAAGAGNAKQEAAAAASLSKAQRQLHAADAARAKLLAENPPLSCVPAG